MFSQPVSIILIVCELFSQPVSIILTGCELFLKLQFPMVSKLSYILCNHLLKKSFN